MRRVIPLAVVSFLLSLAATPAGAVGANEIGGWGDAWGDDAAPSAPPPPRPRAPVPTVQPTAPPQPVRAAQPMAPAQIDTGSWGKAWGEEIVPEQPRPRAAPLPISSPVPPPAAQSPTSRTQAAPAVDIRGWGDAWGDDDPSVPMPAPRTVRSAPQQPVSDQQAPAQRSAPAQMRPASQAQLDGDEAEEPVQLTADQIVHDRELGIVTAKGKVEVGQSGRTLIADTLSYNLKHDVMSASGNVTLIEPTGETLFAEYFELTGDLKEGVGKEFRVLLADRSRLAAAGGIRSGGNRTDFDKAVYTACEPCRNKPNQRPLWEAKAVRITHDQEAQTIEYRDAWIELGGIPIAYTPYLSHPDPTLKRKSGFLAPTGGLSSTLGANITIPYFWAIQDNQDITFTPRFLFPASTAKDINTPGTLDEAQDRVMQRMVLAGNHRWVGTSGTMKTAASITQDRHTAATRGHIDSEGRYDIDQTWRAGYQLQRASDGTYNSIYSYPINNARPWLTTRPYLEGFGRRNYALVEAMSFQGLRPDDDQDNSPFVLPHVAFSNLSRPDSKGGFWNFDNDLLAYTRNEGISSRRVSSSVGWNRPFRGKHGDMTDLSVSMRGDAYHSDHLSNNKGSATAGRAVPQVAMNWRYPFIKESATMPQIIEPIVMVAASPNGGNPANIPNEDSLDSELDEVSILRANRKPGLDRVEGGLRGAYGMRWSAHPRRLGYVSAQVAQGWRAHADSTYSENSGFGERVSDYVSKFDYAPTGNVAFLNRMRLDRETGEIRRNENTLSIGSPLLRLDTSYYWIDGYNSEGLTFPSRQIVNYTLTSQMTRYWAAQVTSSSDLSDDGGPLGWAAKLSYSDECFAFITNFRQSYIQDRDILAGYELTFNVIFKTLGDVPFNVF